MNPLRNYLLSLRGAVFKLLPMKEEELAGGDNHINEYLESLIINLTGAMTTYPILGSQRQYLYVINNMQYIHRHSVEFHKWRKIILNSTRYIDNLSVQYGGETDDE